MKRHESFEGCLLKRNEVGDSEWQCCVEQQWLSTPNDTSRRIVPPRVNDITAQLDDRAIGRRSHRHREWFEKCQERGKRVCVQTL